MSQKWSKEKSERQRSHNENLVSKKPNSDYKIFRSCEILFLSSYDTAINGILIYATAVFLRQF